MRITVNTDDVAADPALRMGEWFIEVPDDKVMAYMEAFVALGFTPTAEVTDE